MISDMFTDNEERLINMYARRPRTEVIRQIEMALAFVNDPVMIDSANALLQKLNGMTDVDYYNLDL